MSEKPKISIVGLGRLGAPIAACFAMRGFDVVGYDPDEEAVQALNDRRSRGHEPGLADVFVRAADRLRATNDLAEAVRVTDVTVLAVPTPGLADGSFSLEHLLPICEAVGAEVGAKSTYHLVIVASTVLPGSTERRVRPALEEASGKAVGDGLGLCYSAVYVTVGNVIQDFLHPDMALVGECDVRSGQLLESVYKDLCENDPPVVRMTPFNAELTKLALNVFVATKISFANVLARLCELMPGGNVDVVTGAMQLDKRVGEGAMCGSIAYGGPFFARDNSAFGTIMRRLDVATQLADEMGRFNRSQVPWLADFVHERLPDGGCVGVLGLSYKPNTDVVEQSPSVSLCGAFAERGVAVVAHDPVAMENARRALPPAVMLAPTVEECLDQADLVVLMTPWKAYSDLEPEAWAREGKRRVVVDCWRVVPHLADVPGVRYVSLGTGPGTPVVSHPVPGRVSPPA